MSRKVLSKRYKTEQQAVDKRRRMTERRESETDVLVTAVTHPREDEIQVLGSSPAVVDLTIDLTSPTRSTPPQVVDLTSESPIILDSVATRRSRRQRNNHVMRPSQRDNILVIDHSDHSGDENDVQEVAPSSSYNTRSAPHRTETSSSSSSTAPGTPKRVITCPVCMEDEPTIHASGQHLTSTTCGHVFCNECIRSAIASQHKCPTCRKRLTMKQIHPIFL